MSNSLGHRQAHGGESWCCAHTQLWEPAAGACVVSEIGCITLAVMRARKGVSANCEYTAARGGLAVSVPLRLLDFIMAAWQ